MQTETPYQAQQILESISDAFFALDAQWRFTYVNSEAERLLLRGRGELLGRGIWDEFPQAVGSTFEACYRRAMETGEAVEFEEFYPPLDAWFSVKAYPAPGGLSVFFRNVNLWKQAQRDLEEREQRFRSLFEGMTQAVVHLDEGGRIRAANPAAEALLGRPAAALLGAPLLGPPWEVVGEGGAPLAPAEQPAAEALRTGKAVSGRILGIRRAPGAPLRWLLMDAAPQRLGRGEDAPTEAYVLFIEITDRRRAEIALRESEEQLRFMAEVVPQMVWMTRPDGSHYYFNRRWYEYTGVAEGSTDGEGWQEVVHPDDAPIADARWRRATATGEPYEIDYRLRRRDGAYRWHLGRAAPRLADDGTILQWVGTCTDIHDQKTTEDALRRSEGRLRRLANASMLGVFFWSENGAISEANDKFLEMVGYERADLEAGRLNWQQLTAAEFAERDRRAVEELTRTKTVAPYEKAFRRRNGEALPVLIGATLVEEESVEGVAFVVDISDRKAYEQELRVLNETLEERIHARTEELSDANARLREAQQALSVAHSRLTGIIDSTEDRICAIDTSQRFTAFNEAFRAAFREATGAPPEVGMTLTAHDRGPGLPYLSAERVRQALRGEVVTYQTEGGAEETVYEVSLTPIRSAEGALIGTALFARDVTARVRAQEAGRRSEMHFREALQNMPVMLARLDASLRYEWAHNPPGDGALPEGFYALCREALASGRTLRREIGVERPDGVHTYDFTATPLVDGGGPRPAALTVVGYDNSERRKAQQALEESKVQLERINRELTHRNRELQDFAYVASHDLQEPLRKIHAFSDILVSEYGPALDETAQFYIQRMQDAASRMTGLIRDLLAFSRISTRGASFQPVDLEQTIHQVLSDLEVRIQETAAVVEVGPLPVVQADPTQMHQLLLNLIGNALKFHREGAPPHIQVQARPGSEPTAAGEPSVVLEVSDNGIGFEERYLDRIFSPFQRLHTREYEGTGMGLAICRRIVERHHGSITARSAPGAGSAFLCTLPLARINGRAAAEAPKA